MNKLTTQASPNQFPRTICLSEADIRHLVFNGGKQLRTAITSKDFGDSRFEYDENHNPMMGTVNNKIGVITKPIDNTKPRITNIIYSPFGNVGTKVVVNEAWRIGAYNKRRGLLAIDYKATPEIKKTAWIQISDDLNGNEFRTQLAQVAAELRAKGIEQNEDGTWSWEAGQAPLRWQPARAMPEWASRLKLVVSKVSVESSLDNVFNWDFVTDFNLLKG